MVLQHGVASGITSGSQPRWSPRSWVPTFCKRWLYATRLNQSHSDEEYRLLRQSLFERLAGRSTVPQEAPLVPVAGPQRDNGRSMEALFSSVRSLTSILQQRHHQSTHDVRRRIYMYPHQELRRWLRGNLSNQRYPAFSNVPPVNDEHPWPWTPMEATQEAFTPPRGLQNARRIPPPCQNKRATALCAKRAQARCMTKTACFPPRAEHLRLRSFVHLRLGVSSAPRRFPHRLSQRLLSVMRLE